MLKKLWLLIFITCFGTGCFAAFPESQGFVTDLTNTLTQNEISELSYASQQVEKKTGVQIVTVIVKNTDGTTVEDYAQTLFEKWGIGQKGKDDGLLFLVALDEKKMRIEVGYGLEGILTDGQSGDILRQYVTPFFKQDQYQEGIVNGHLALIQHIAKAYNVSIPANAHPQPVKKRGTSFGDTLSLLIFIAILWFIFRGRNGGLLPLLFLGGSLSGGSRGSSSFGSFGGQSFGGFGGGSSGGGGASSSW